ncbi:glucoamylase family protein [soil metagenome]
MSISHPAELQALVAPGHEQALLDHLKCRSFDYFRHEHNPANGLVADKNQPGAPASIAVLGMALTAYTIAVENKFFTRTEAIERTLAALRFLKSSHQGVEADATGYKGFYYHFLDMQSGKRTWQSELSTIDTAILMAGVLIALSYFDGDNAEERELREIADFLYRRVEWPWALNGAATFSHGWTPEKKFQKHRWNTNYSEALILYVLALGSPSHPIDAKGYHEWTSTFQTLNIYESECLHAGPFFIHQMSHLWIDFRGIKDEFNKRVGFDYFENSKRATFIQRQYAIENPKNFPHYGEHCWGLTASDGPGPVRRTIKGVKRVFYDYIARGVPDGPDDGTISPWAVLAALPFAPDIVLETIRHMIQSLGEKGLCQYGFGASYNPSFKPPSVGPAGHTGWTSPWVFGLNQGSTLIMVQNYQSQLPWSTMKKCPYLLAGLRAAGFAGGWLDSH